MRPETLARAGLGLLVLALVVLGFLAVGGPGQGRMERHDQARINDLQNVESYLRCVIGAEGALPETLEMRETCRREVRLTDPYTGAPYRYERVSDTGWLLCAGFEVPERLSYVSGFDPETGCLSGSFTP